MERLVLPVLQLLLLISAFTSTEAAPAFEENQQGPAAVTNTVRKRSPHCSYYPGGCSLNAEPYIPLIAPKLNFRKDEETVTTLAPGNSSNHQNNTNEESQR
ncbi:uncharacterized protein V6R79_023859 [Siganus canaliculatus]